MLKKIYLTKLSNRGYKNSPALPTFINVERFKYSQARVKGVN